MVLDEHKELDDGRNALVLLGGLIPQSLQPGGEYRIHKGGQERIQVIELSGFDACNCSLDVVRQPSQLHPGLLGAGEIQQALHQESVDLPGLIIAILQLLDDLQIHVWGLCRRVEQELNIWVFDGLPQVVESLGVGELLPVFNSRLERSPERTPL